jgi:MerR family transcriptional regulator, light-induced transcriptional regulator
LEQNFSPKQIADALRVSESSIKRWCDRGAIQTVKTLGGHRRIPLDSLLAFLESTNRDLADLSAIGLDVNTVRSNAMSPSVTRPSSEEEANRFRYFEEALIRGDEKDCRRLLIEWYGYVSSFANVGDELICRSFANLGEAWHQGKIEIFQERRACEICSRLINEFRRLFADPGPLAPSAIGAAASGDYYSLPSQMVEVTLREAGWQAINLGVNLPLDTILEAVRIERPKLFWLSVSHLVDQEKFVEDYAKFWSSLPRETVVVVGGRALTDLLRPRLKYTAHCDTLQQLSMLAKTLKSQVLVAQSSPI